MLAYKYDKTTKEYLGTQEAQVNPLEGGYLCPIDSTFKKPMEKETYYAPCFINENWELVTDRRGDYIVNLDDITFIEVDFLGDAPIGYQFVNKADYEKYMADNDAFKVIDGAFVDVTDTAEYKAIKLQEAKEEKLQEAIGGAKYYIDNEACFQFDENNSIEATDGNIGKLTAYALGFQTGQYEKVYWTSKEDNVIELNQEDLIRVLIGLGSIQSYVWNVQYVEYKNLINEAKTVEEVKAIIIDYRMPEKESEVE